MNRRRFIGLVCAAGAAWFVRPAAFAADAPAEEELVRDAIRRQRVLRLTYAGFTRLVEPHALGRTAGGHRALLAWQIEGGSRTHPPVGWRTFLVGEIADLRLTGRGFARRPGYRRDTSGLHEVEIEVTPSEDAATNRPGAARD